MKMNFDIQKKPKVENVEKAVLRKPRDVYNLKLIQEIKDAIQEHIVMIGLDKQNNIRVSTILAIGSQDKSPVDVKDILRTALINACSSVILVHNHPANSLKPSQDDIYFTNTANKFLRTFNIQLMDHIIVTENDYTSMGSLNLINENNIDPKFQFVDKVLLVEENKKMKKRLCEVAKNMNNIEKNYKLSDGKYFHFHTSDEGYDYTIYNPKGINLDGGILEYTDMDYKKCSLKNIKTRLAEFTGIKELENDNLEEVSQDFIDKFEELKNKRIEELKNKRQFKLVKENELEM